jgi:hypothetical protein
LGYFLPWLLVTPFVRLSKLRNESDRQLARALVLSAAVPLFICNLIPGATPRYSLPVLTPFCWLLAMIFVQDAFLYPAWLNRIARPLWPRAASVFIALALLTGLVGFPLAAVAAKHRPKVKNIAEQINAAVPANETLYAVHPNYQPFFFYIHAPIKYVDRLEELPRETRYFVVRPNKEEAAAGSQQWWPRHARSILRLQDYRKQTVILFVVDPS